MVSVKLESFFHLFFNICVDDLIYQLKAIAGCCVCGRFFGCVMYADDLLLLSASFSGLQHMLDICHKFGLLNDILFNHKNLFVCKLGFIVIALQLQ